MGIETEIKEWVRGGLIGAGSFGTVSLAINKSHGELFAVKSLSTEFISVLENEYNILKSLDSPYVVRCLGKDQSVENGVAVCNLLMEYMPGGSVGDLLTKFGGKLEESVVKAYSRCILRAIEYLHGQGIVHCDIKGKNVLVGPGGVKLADFGSAKRAEDKGLSVKNSLRGTPLWMAPEVVNQVEQGPPSDIWSLGCTVVEMAAGRPPWSDVSNPLAAMYRIACTHELPDLPRCLSAQGRDFLEKCLRRDPKQRWTAAQLLSHPFLNDGDYSAANVESAPLSPTSTLDSGHRDCDSSSSDLLQTVPVLSLKIERFREEIDAEEEEESIERYCSPKASPRERVLALAAGCVRPDWCSSPPTAQWVAVRSNSSKIK